MTINLGKRDPGNLTASSPGDTLYIPLQFYNDSGASISIGATLAVTDIELFKNGGTTERATDSGYAILGDTGNFDNRTGFKGISVQLFNTSDDTGFYDAGSQYWVAIDSVTVDARTVRFFPAVFEIGTPRANVVEVDGDTGYADRLGKFASLLTAAGQVDTGTGIADTGSHATAVWAKSARTLTALDVDTGLRDLIADLDTGLRGHIDNADTGLRGFIDNVDTGLHVGLSVNVDQIDGDTGAATHLAQLADEHDTGRLQAEATATLDTGAVNQAVWQADAARALTAWTFDTGVQQAIARLDTGMSETIDRILADTDTGLHTGLSVNATVTGLSDTGINERLTAIEAKTASLTFTVAGQVDANIQYVNDVAVTGTGDTGTADTWGP